MGLVIISQRPPPLATDLNDRVVLRDRSFQVIPSADWSNEPRSPHATKLPLAYEIALKLFVVVDVLGVHVNPSGDVRIIGRREEFVRPTATNKFWAKLIA